MLQWIAMMNRTDTNQRQMLMLERRPVIKGGNIKNKNKVEDSPANEANK